MALHGPRRKQFYAESQGSYVVSFPDKTVVKSTATALGMIKLPTLMSDADQLAEVRRQTDAFLAGLHLDDEGRQVIVEGGGSTAHYTLDTSRAIEYNREEIIVNPDGSLTVSAVLQDRKSVV